MGVKTLSQLWRILTLVHGITAHLQLCYSDDRTSVATGYNIQYIERKNTTPDPPCALYALLVEGISTEQIPNPNSKNAPTTDSTARSARHSANVSSFAASRPAASYPSVDICTSWQSTGSSSSLPCLALPVNRRSVMWHSCDVSGNSIAQKNAQRQGSFSLPFCPQTPLFFSPPVRCGPSNCCPATPCLALLLLNPHEFCRSQHNPMDLDGDE
jgi:hypothetical protein